MKLDYTAISAWAALGAAIAAVVTLWVEGARSRFAHGLDLLTKFDEIFHGEDFKKKRRAVAEVLRRGKRDLERNEALEEIEDILDHFEVLGLLLAKGSLDKELVWAYYFYWIKHYYFLLQDDIQRMRKVEPDAWEDVDWLYAQLAAFQRKKYPAGSDAKPSEESKEAFFVRECSL